MTFEFTDSSLTASTSELLVDVIVGIPVTVKRLALNKIHSLTDRSLSIMMYKQFCEVRTVRDSSLGQRKASQE